MKLFRRTGKTAVLSASTTTGNVALEGTGDIHSQLAIYNAGSVDVFVRTGDSSVTAVFPTAGNPQEGIIVKAGDTRGITMPIGHTYIAAITASSTASVYVTPGVGI